MRRSFYEKVKRMAQLTPKNYRYVLEDFGNVARLPIKYLDTTKAYGGWKIIKIPVEWK
jgi:hypothetical protein